MKETLSTRSVTVERLLLKIHV